MKLSTWATTLSILTSTVVIIGSGIVRFTEPRVLRTLPPTLPSARPVEPGPRSEHGAPALPLGPSRDAHPASPSFVKPHAGNVERRAQTVNRAIAAAGLCGVPAGIGLRLFAHESGFRQFDSSGRLLISSSGAVGVGQIKPSSAAEVSRTLDVRDEWQNMVASMCYLSSRRGTWREKVLAYRVGASGVRTAAAHAYADVILEGER